MAPFKNKIGSSLVWVTPCEDVRMLVHIQLQNCIKFKYSAEMQSSILDEAGSADNRSSTGYLHYLVKRRRKKEKKLHLTPDTWGAYSNPLPTIN